MGRFRRHPVNSKATVCIRLTSPHHQSRRAYRITSRVEPRTGDDLARHNNLAYTIPVLRITPDKYVMDCDKICAELEAAYPEPSIRIDDPVVAKVKASLSRVLGALAPEIMPRVGFNIVTDKSHDYFWRTREARFGMPLEKVPEELGGEKCWKPAEEELREVAKLLKERGGPFFLGKEPSWADFIWAGFLIFAKRADEEIWERCVGVDEVLKKQFEACKPWVEKND